MKRLFILATAAIVALASCSKTQVVYNDAPEEIGFKAVTSVMTKAPLNGTINLPTNQGNMVVYATKSSDNSTYDEAFSGVQFTYKTSYWGGVTAQYWPNSGWMKFMAYYPYGIGTATGKATSSVKISGIDIESSQTDVLYTNLTAAQECENKDVVPMEFIHALAQIQVTAAVSDANMTNVRISKVEIVTPNMGGDLTLTGLDATWDNEVAMDGNYLMNNTISETDLETTPTSLGTGALVVPGNQTGLKITYTIGGIESSVTKDLADGSPTWDKSKKYIYNLTVTLNEIKLSASVTDWADGGTTSPSI